MKFEILGRGGWDESKRLTAYSFRDNTGEFTEWYYNRKTDNVFAMRDESGELAAQVLDSRVNINIRGKAVPASVISHVATDPGYRSRGIMGKLLPMALGELRKDGVILAALYPSAYSFYMRYGFAARGDCARIALPLDRLRPAAMTGKLKWFGEPTPDELNELTACYNAAHSDVSGSMIRGVDDMSRRVEDFAMCGTNVFRLYRNGKLTSYWFWRDEGGIVSIDECAFTDDADRRDFLSCLASHASTHREARLLLPAYEPLLKMFPERHARITVEPWAMFAALGNDSLDELLPGQRVFLWEQY